MFSTNLYKFLPKNGQIMYNSCKKKIIHLFLTVSQIYSESQGLVNLLVFYKKSLEFKSKWVSVSSYAAVENTVMSMYSMETTIYFSDIFWKALTTSDFRLHQEISPTSFFTYMLSYVLQTFKDLISN